jgi:hypothetical protein
VFQWTGIKRTIGSFIQNWYVDNERIMRFGFTFNDFRDKRTNGCILKASFVDCERFRSFSLGTKPGLDKQPLVVE